ncbi:hypothetical protein AMECASPLE_034007 [Ameca splendens]|uniref:Uncharacterized protein n=1 Tax=Ameca splendens TaxID=208324 RepID=A0ABV0ZUQ5_9TELE
MTLHQVTELRTELRADNPLDHCILVLVVFRFIQNQDSGAADSVKTPRLPSPQTPPSAPPRGTQCIPRPADRHSPCSVSWATPSSLFTKTDWYSVPITAAAAPIHLSISRSILPSLVNKTPRYLNST